LLVVPELTCSADIKLNKRVSFAASSVRVMTAAPYIFPNPVKSRGDDGFRYPQERYAPMNAAERNVSAESKVPDQNVPLQSPEPTPSPAWRSRLALAGYVAAIALATLGWLWLIAWIAFKLF